MARDSMQALLRLRQLTVDEARRDLAACLAQEAAAQDAADIIEAAIARETSEACRLQDGDQAVEAFAAWLQQIRPRAQAAGAALDAAVLHTTEARAVLAAARAGAEAVETVMARREADRAAEAARAEQHALEETARGRQPLDAPDRAAEANGHRPRR